MIHSLIRKHPIIACSLAASYFGAIAFKLFGAPRETALWVGLPALLVTGWAALGHLITLDDDYPNEWSNPEGDEAFWRASVLDLLAKLAVFALLAIVIAAW